MTLATSERYRLYQPTVSTSVFDVPFPIFDLADVEVHVDGVLDATAVIAGTFSGGTSTDATVTLSAGVVDVNVEVFGSRDPRRENDFTGSSPGIAEGFQDDMDALTAVQQEQHRKIATLTLEGAFVFGSRAAAIASNVADTISRIGVIHNGLILEYISDDAGTALTTADSRTWSPNGQAFADHWGCLGDGTTDETALFTAIKAYTTLTGKNVMFATSGTYMTDEVIAGAVERLDICGAAWLKNKPVIKLNDNVDSNLFQASANGAELIFENLTIDQNRDNQTAGHGIRSGGCTQVSVKRCTIQNCRNYGFGAQAGTTAIMRFEDVEFSNIGRDCIDVKDFNSDNGVFYARDIRAFNWGLDQTTNVIVDIRGPANVRGVYGDAKNDCYGVRFRQSSVQGRAGYGVIGDVIIDGNGTNTIVAAHMASDNGKAVFDTIHGENVSAVLLQSTEGRGGVVKGLTSADTYGDGMSIQGHDLVITGASLQCAATATRCFDIEPSAVRPQITGLNALNANTSETEVGRIQVGAADVLVSGVMRSSASSISGVNGIGDAGTSSVLTDVRGFLV